MLVSEFHISRVANIIHPSAQSSTEVIKQVVRAASQQLGAGLACATCGWFSGADMHAEVRVSGNQVIVDRVFCPRHAANVGTVS